MPCHDETGPLRFCEQKTVLAGALSAHYLRTYCVKHSYEIYAAEVCSRSQICLCGRVIGSIEIRVLQIAQYTKFCSEFGIVSEIIIISSGVIVFIRVDSLGGQVWEFLAKSADRSSLEDQDKQQISFFLIHFTVKYSDRLVATTMLKVLDLKFLKVMRSVHLSLQLSKILVQFVTVMLFSGHVGICFT